MIVKRVSGWTVYILGTADNYMATGMCKSMKKRLAEINTGKGGPFFGKRKYRRPVKILFEDSNLPFLEAFAKFRYLRKISSVLKRQLISTKRWPLGGYWLEYLKTHDPIKI